MALDRRRFFEITGLSALGIAGARVLPLNAQVVRPGALSGLTAKRWAMVVDASKCLGDAGCDKCIRACHAWHNVPDLGNPKEEVKWIWKEPLKDALPDEYNAYLPQRLRDAKLLVFCNHCSNPPCVRVCPTQATWKREDGIVMMDWHRCIGCRYCMAACPYGSRSFNWRDPRPFIEKINPEFPTRTRGVVEKCDFCEERLAKGLLPACVEACDKQALIFGDLSDPQSPVRKILSERPALRRKPSLGTEPEVFYLV
jgi:molybdopterin-containing oxidoreductase family iron-sulfur binding subunit